MCASILVQYNIYRKRQITIYSTEYYNIIYTQRYNIFFQLWVETLNHWLQLQQLLTKSKAEHFLIYQLYVLPRDSFFFFFFV